MAFKVHYILQENECNNGDKIFLWLKIDPPNLLRKDPTEYDINNDDKVLYIQWGSSRGFDDIVHVQRILPNYLHETDANDIFILAISTIDGERKHLHDCATSQKVTKGRITFIEIHCSYNDDIYDCRGNNETKAFLCSELKSTEEEKDQHLPHSQEVKRVMRNSYNWQMNANEVFTTMSTWVRRFLNWISIRSLTLFATGLSVLVLYLYN